MAPTPIYAYNNAPTRPATTGGMRLGHGRARLNNSGNVKLVNLENFDEYSHKIDFNTPRSIESLRRLGIEPQELLHQPLESFLERVDRSILASIPNYAQRYYEHRESRRQNKIEQLRAIRRKLRVTGDPLGDDCEVISVSSDATGSSVVEQAQRKVVTALENERREVMRMHQREMSKIKNRVLYELKCATLKQQQEEMLRQQEERTQMEREQHEREIKARAERDRRQRLALKESAERAAEEERRRAHAEWLEGQERAEEQRQAEERKRLESRMDQQAAAKRAEARKQQLDEILQMQRDTIDAKAAELQAREDQRLAALEQQRQLDAAEAQRLRLKKEKRFQTAQTNQQRMEEEKRAAYEEKARLAEERRIALEEQRAAEAAENERRARHKQAMIERAQRESERQLEAKRVSVLERHAAIRERLEAEEAARAADEKRRFGEVNAAEKRRRDAYKQATQILDARVANVNQRISDADRRHQAMLEIRERQTAEKKLTDSLVQTDRYELVRHTENVRIAKAEKLMQRINQDSERVATMKRTYQLLQKQREMIRHTAQSKTKAIVGKFEQLAHKGRWDVLTDDDPKRNLLIRTGVLGREDIQRVVTSPKRSASASQLTQSSRTVRQLMPASPNNPAHITSAHQLISPPRRAAWDEIQHDHQQRLRPATSANGTGFFITQSAGG